MMANKEKYSFLIKINGIVQGVGFRPFIYNLARSSGFSGNVSNTTEGVLIKINTSNSGEVENFIGLIKENKPAPALIKNIVLEKIPYEDIKGFHINKSIKTDSNFQLISPDIATCPKCINDILNPDNINRYHYPFTNCTNCGPRFTIIKEMPYDRQSTTMNSFTMCEDCTTEYNDPLDRRFHAQPNACKKCGPVLELIDDHGNTVGTDDPLEAAARLLLDGKIIGIKSLGGFQIACDGRSDQTVKILRERKLRPSKPFAIMVRNIDRVKSYYHLDALESSILGSTKAPIVLLKKNNKTYPLSYQVSLDNKRDGIMLPYTPIHHILFEYIDIPLIMTSGNITEEPIASNNDEALKKLNGICDYYLIHNRGIYSAYDDSVVKVFRKKEMILRRARGYAPYPVSSGIGIDGKNILATGAHEKNTLTFLTGDHAITTQHIGDLDNVNSINFFRSTYNDYKKLFGIKDFDIIAHDIHPDYASTRFAQELDKSGKKLVPVQHHEAHIASVLAENNINGDLLGFSWDGTGLGRDGKIWGSEVFLVDDAMRFTRIAHLSEKVLPGGSVSIKKPYRMTIVYLKRLFNECDIKDLDFEEYIYRIQPEYKDIIDLQEIGAVTGQIMSGFNSPVTTSMGRLFDAVSSLLGINHIISFEGEAAISLEMIIDEKQYGDLMGCSRSGIEKDKRYRTRLDKNNNESIIDDFIIFSQIIDDIKNGKGKSEISYKFHNTLAQIVLDISMDSRKNNNIENIALSGGVFQNGYLLDLCFELLENNDFKVFSNFKVPVNDGGISLGQAYIASINNISNTKGA
ncbi:carbamoyltransferase HypF [Actinomycetota bacterium]